MLVIIIKCIYYNHYQFVSKNFVERGKLIFICLIESPYYTQSAWYANSFIFFFLIWFITKILNLSMINNCVLNLNWNWILFFTF